MASGIAVVSVFACACESGAATPANTEIVNVARTLFTVDATSGSSSSNAITNRVDEVLDLTLAAKASNAGSIPAGGTAPVGIPFVLTNTGNGNEAFHVEAIGPAQDGALTVATDVDGNGAYDPAVDITLPTDGTTAALAPGAHLDLLLVFAKVPTDVASATVRAKAVTGSGTPGTLFAGAGDGGSDAVVGQTHAEASLHLSYQPGTATGPLATLEKSQTVLAPDGSAKPVQGAVVTYRLALTTTGATPLHDAEIVDPIPAGTTFVPGSIRIEDVAASDVSDADAATFDGQSIHIALGDISQPTTRVVTFRVTIQ